MARPISRLGTLKVEPAKLYGKEDADSERDSLCISLTRGKL